LPKGRVEQQAKQHDSQNKHFSLHFDAPAAQKVFPIQASHS
jgi:hypothetical protein